ncbi:MAG: hypothetical protein H0U27_01735 [Nitrosopumilus sp.]|nr:hypothetical protein [Nitrosopumilus sp.]
MEKIADGLLFLPKVMWNERTVTIIGEDRNNVTIENSNSFTNNIETLGINLGVRGFAGTLVSAMVSVAYAIGSVVSTPLLGVGLALKEASIKEGNSKTHHLLLKSAPKLVELENKKLLLKQEIENFSQPNITLIRKLNELIDDEDGVNDEKLLKTMGKSIDSFTKYRQIVNTKKQVILEIEELRNQRNLLV